jgi:5'-nucleotidase
MKRYLIPILTLLLVSCASNSVQPDTDRYTQLVIVGTNDVHGYVRPKEEDFYGQKVISGGAEWFGGYMRILQKKFGERLIILDGGDIFQGTLDSNSFLGKPMIDYYNLLPYRAAAVGNHEFDYGAETKAGKDRLGALKARIKQAKFPFLSANIQTLDGKNWQPENLFPSTSFSVDGIKIGVIGLTTESTPLKTRPQNVASLNFISILEATKREASKLRADGAEIILIAAHEGGDHPDEPVPQLLAALPPGTIDAFVAGHFHLKTNTFMSGVPVIQSMTQGKFFGRIDLFFDRQTRKVITSQTKIHETIAVCGTQFRDNQGCNAKKAKEEVSKDAASLEKFLPIHPASYESEEVKPDLRIRQVLAPYLDKVAALRARVVGQASRDFEKLPSGETETGNLLNDALLLAYPQAKVAYYNGGGIRRMLAKGPVTYGDMFEVMPFDNVVVLAKVSGQDLRHMIQIGVTGDYLVPAVAGVRFTYSNSDDPSFERDLNGDGKKEKWERNRLLSLTWNDGKDVKDSDEFWLVTNDFLLGGGDRMGFIFDKLPRSRVKISDVSLLDSVVNQLPKLKGQLPPKLSQPRITVVSQ